MPVICALGSTRGHLPDACVRIAVQKVRLLSIGLPCDELVCLLAREMPLLPKVGTSFPEGLFALGIGEAVRQLPESVARKLLPQLIHQLVDAGLVEAHEGLERDSETRAGAPGKRLQRPGGRTPAPALESSDDGLGRLHAFGQLRLGEPGANAGRDQRTRQRKLEIEIVISPAVVRVPVPLLVQIADFAHWSTSRARCRASRTSLWGVLRVFLMNTRTTMARFSRTVT